MNEKVRRGRGRPQRVIPSVEITFTLPLHVKNTLYALLIDPVYQRPPHGKISEYLTSLVIADLRRQGHPVLPPEGESALTTAKASATMIDSEQE